MNDTKQKILDSSLMLFNDFGISNVSLRAIASEAGISVGNLQYHFKKREDVIEAIYFQLVERINTIYIIPNDNLLLSFFNISAEVIKILYEYHFFLLNFVSITRNNKKIKSHYSKLSKRREKESLEFISVLIQQGMFREELLKNEYEGLYKRIEVITNFWFSSILIQSKALSKKSIQEYSLLIGQSIFPYLTDEGKKQYCTLFPDRLL